MSVLIGYCEHGKIVAAIMGPFDDSGELEGFASSHHRVEIAESCTFEGECLPCKKRYKYNRKLIDAALHKEMNQLAIQAAEEIERTLFMVESEYHNKIMKSESYFREDAAEIIDRVCCGPHKEAVRELVKASQNALVILVSLHRSVEWELAPSIKGDIADSLPNLTAALASIAERAKL